MKGYLLFLLYTDEVWRDGGDPRLSRVATGADMRRRSPRNMAAPQLRLIPAVVCLVSAESRSVSLSCRGKY